MSNNLEREARVRERARELWEQHGRPNGREREFAERAAQELREAENSAGHGATPDQDPKPSGPS